MDFSSSTFPSRTSRLSNMSSTNVLMSCQFTWTRSTESNVDVMQRAIPDSQPATTPQSSTRAQRFAPCQGRLYHQLLCSHRIRTDLVEDCGVNCLEPYGDPVEPMFVCNECLQAESSNIWNQRKTQHDSEFAPLHELTQAQYNQYYAEHRLLEANFRQDQEVYEIELRAKMRSSNVCLTAETSREEVDVATGMGSLSLAQNNCQPLGASLDHLPIRRGLPNDASEQLHWNLATLALDRGSCGVEYPSPAQAVSGSSYQPMNGG